MNNPITYRGYEITVSRAIRKNWDGTEYVSFEGRCKARGCGCDSATPERSLEGVKRSIDEAIRMDSMPSYEFSDDGDQYRKEYQAARGVR